MLYYTEPNHTIHLLIDADISTVHCLSYHYVHCTVYVSLNQSDMMCTMQYSIRHVLVAAVLRCADCDVCALRGGGAGGRCVVIAARAPHHEHEECVDTV